MPNINGRGKSTAENRSHHGPHTIHNLTGANRIFISGRFGRFDIVHRFDKIVYLYRQYGRQNRWISKHQL